MDTKTSEMEEEMVVETSDKESMSTDELEVETSNSSESELKVFNETVGKKMII